MVLSRHCCEDNKFLETVTVETVESTVATSGRPKRVNTEITETEISVWFTEPKPIIPNRNSKYIRFSNILVLSSKKMALPSILLHFCLPVI